MSDQNPNVQLTAGSQTPVNAGSPTNNQPYGSGMTQVDSGPAALLYDLSNELIEIYSEVQALYNEMTQLETNVQKTSINAGADAQVGAAKDQAFAIGSQAFGSFLGGAVAIGQAGMTSYTNTEATTQLGTEEGNLTQLNTLSKTSQAVANGNPDVIVSDENTTPTDSAVEARALELQNGTYKSTNPQSAANAEYSKNLDQAALQKLQQNGGLDDFRSDLQDSIANQSRTVNNLQTQIQLNQTKWNTYGQIGTGVANGVTQSFQAGFTAASGTQQACQQISQGNQSLANGTAESTRQGIGKYYDQIASVIASARQGAQAYAQT
ncbi:MAG: hypothetical protein JSS60_08285 [Verrucomicrobia bacterium]|nr:hypothetical protein [Verrucomicrobiota bacterium]